MNQSCDWAGRWAGRPAYILGAKATPEDLARVRRAGRVIAIGDAFKSARWPDVVFAASQKWFEDRLDELRETTESCFWCSDPATVNRWIHPVDLGPVKDDLDGAVRLAGVFGAASVEVVGI